MLNKVRIGIVGAGWIVQRAHIPSLLENKYAEIKAIYDINFKIAKEIGSKYGITAVYDNYELFLKSGLDAIVIATPNFTHVEYATKALESKINVLCEKPIAFTLNEIKKIIQIANENRVIFMPGYVNRWRCDIQQMLELIRQGLIGKIKNIQAGWIRSSGIPRPGTWFTNKELSGGGVLLDLGSHVIDICQLMVKNIKPISYSLEIESCDSKSDMQNQKAQWFNKDVVTDLKVNVEKSAFATINFINNIKMEIQLSWNAPTKGDSTFFVIHGEKGRIVLKTLFGFSQDFLFDEDSLEIFLDDKSHRYIFSREENNSEKAFRRMHSYFIDCVRGFSSYCPEDSVIYQTVEITESLYKNITKESIEWEKELNNYVR